MDNVYFSRVRDDICEIDFSFKDKKHTINIKVSNTNKGHNGYVYDENNELIILIFAKNNQTIIQSINKNEEDNRSVKKIPKSLQHKVNNQSRKNKLYLKNYTELEYITFILLDKYFCQ